MYQHHIESIENMKNYFAAKEEVIALVFGGSVAKGCEREDSDLDAMVIISDDKYAERKARNATAETIDDLCTYAHGYIDVKYMTKQFLKDAAEKGSEPSRNAFVKAKVLFTKDSEIPDIVAKIPVFQEKEKDEKMLSFYSDFWLNYYYFLKSCPVDGYMQLHATNEVIYSIYRMVLQQNNILFPSNRRLEEFVNSISTDTEHLVSLGKKFAASQNIKDGDEFVDCFFKLIDYKFPEDIGVVLSQYTTDFEQWWRNPRPNINEW